MRRLRTKASRRRWYDQSSWAVLGHGEKLILLCHRPNIGGTRASWFPGGLGSGQQLQAVLMLGPGLGFQCRSGCWTFLGMGLPRQRTPPAFFYQSLAWESVRLFNLFLRKWWHSKPNIAFISPSPFNVSRVSPSLYLTSKVSLPKSLA